MFAGGCSLVFESWMMKKKKKERKKERKKKKKKKNNNNNNKKGILLRAVSATLRNVSGSLGALCT